VLFLLICTTTPTRQLVKYYWNSCPYIIRGRFVLRRPSNPPPLITVRVFCLLNLEDFSLCFPDPGIFYAWDCLTISHSFVLLYCHTRIIRTGLAQWTYYSTIAQEVAGLIPAQYKHCVHEDALRSVGFNFNNSISNIGQSLNRWRKFYYLKLLRASEGMLTLVPAALAVVSTYQPTLGPRGGLWPFLLMWNPQGRPLPQQWGHL
jgi:hypothetical protein